MLDLNASIVLFSCAYVAIAAVLAVCLNFHRIHKAAEKRIAEAVDQRLQQTERRLECAEAAIVRMQSQVAELEGNVRLLSGAPAQSWTNINRRTQALRMLRGGDKSSRIAAELSMSRGEVDLIRKVHSLTIDSYETADTIKNSDEHSNFSIGG